MALDPNKTLLVPILLDALYLSKPTELTSPSLDFSKMPSPGNHAPFYSATLKDTKKKSFPKGLHLHWAIPDGLTKAMELRIVRKSDFESKLSSRLIDLLWKAMLSTSWIKTLPSGITISLTREKRLEKTPSGKHAALLLEHLDTINLILDQPSLPPAPNRWLVTSFEGKKKSIKDCWYIESDFQYAEGSSEIGNNSGVAFPYFTKLVKENDPKFKVTSSTSYGGANFRIVGRSSYCGADYKNLSKISMPATKPVAPATGNFYTSDPLTALGYGDPNFAALYPNCKNIFGLCAESDPSTVTNPSDINYEIMGWHSDPNLDYYGLFVKNFKSQHTGQEQNITLLKEVKNQFRWLIPITVKETDAIKGETLKSITATIGGHLTTAWDYLLKTNVGWLTPARTTGQATIATPALDGIVHLPIQFNSVQRASILAILNAAIEAQLPVRMICCARKNITLTGQESSGVDKAKVKVVAGHTGAEAIATLISKTASAELSTDPKTQEQLNEEFQAQLATLLEASKLSVSQTDRVAKLAEARHDKGFMAENGGSIWTLRPIPPVGVKADQNTDAQATLPLGLADSLNQLNIAQQALDRYDFEIQSVRKQIYLDWCKYQLELYGADQGQLSDKMLAYILDDGSITTNQQSTKALTAMLSNRKTMAEDVMNAISKVLRISFENITDWPTLVSTLQKQNYLVFPAPFTSALAGYNPKNLTPNQESTILQALNSLIDRASLPVKNGGENLPAKAKVIWDAPHENPFQKFNQQFLSSLFESINIPYVLQQKAAPRFWRPRDPVILFNGGGLKPNLRNGQDGLLTCMTTDYKLGVCGSKLGTKADPNWATEIQSLYTEIHPQLVTLQGEQKTNFAFSPITQDSVHPFRLNWKVIFAEALNTPPSQSHDYQKNYISVNYDLKQNEADFKSKGRKLSPDAGELAGETILSSYANKRLQSAIDTFLSNTYPIKNESEFFTSNDVVLTYNKVNGQTMSANNLKSELLGFINWCKERMQLKQSFFKAKNIPVAEQNDTYIQANLSTFRAWLSENVGSILYKTNKTTNYNKIDFNIVIAILQQEISEAYHSTVYIFCSNLLQDTQVVSQSLGGFHEALLMENFGYQLGVQDPSALHGLGFLDNKPLEQIRTIGNAVGTQNVTSPEIGSDYNPIRAGALKLDNLALIDTFGRSLLSLDYDDLSKKLLTPDAMKLASSPGYIGLNPRFSQAARLNFRFLSADDQLVEMNDHVATSPICGWLVPNLLDNSLMVYGQDGQALGYVDQTGSWQVYPGTDGPFYPDAIPNTALSQVVCWVCKNGWNKGESSPFMDKFMGVIANGVENADPENFAQHQALALLMSRPLAVIQTSVELELKGQTAFSQALDQFTGIDANFDRTTNKFEDVKFPIRLGEYDQQNDGVIGYWQGAPNVKKSFYAPQTDVIVDPMIKTRANNLNNFDIQMSASQAPQIVTMIVEPQAYIHATTGILPTKAIQIPSDQYAKALKKIEVAFLTAPLITPDQQLNISLPKEAGYNWTWMQQKNKQWRQISNQGIVKRKDLKESFPENWLAVWNQLIQKGWLDEISPSEAQIIAKDQRKVTKLDASFSNLEIKIEHWLQSHQLFSFNSKANFTDDQVIKEGWLNLKLDSNS